MRFIKPFIPTIIFLILSAILIWYLGQGEKKKKLEYKYGKCIRYKYGVCQEWSTE